LDIRNRELSNPYRRVLGRDVAGHEVEWQGPGSDAGTVLPSVGQRHGASSVSHGRMTFATAERWDSRRATRIDLGPPGSERRARWSTGWQVDASERLAHARRRRIRLSVRRALLAPSAGNRRRPTVSTEEFAGEPERDIQVATVGLRACSRLTLTEHRLECQAWQR